MHTVKLYEVPAWTRGAGLEAPAVFEGRDPEYMTVPGLMAAPLE